MDKCSLNKSIISNLLEYLAGITLIVDKFLDLKVLYYREGRGAVTSMLL